MSNANGRDQMTSILLEAQIFTPLKHILKINTMQYQGGLALYSPSQQTTVKIDPVELRKSQAKFKVTDGLTPTEKIIGGEDFTSALQVIGSSPQIGAAYNIGPIFSYLMKTRNVDLSAFEKTPEQIAYEQAMGQWQQAASQVAELAKTTTMKIEGVTMESLQTMIQKLLPPQPTPEQFGYSTGTKNPSQSSPAAQAPRTLTSGAQ